MNAFQNGLVYFSLVSELHMALFKQQLKIISDFNEFIKFEILIIFSLVSFLKAFFILFIFYSLQFIFKFTYLRSGSIYNKFLFKSKSNKLTC